MKVTEPGTVAPAAELTRPTESPASQPEQPRNDRVSLETRSEVSAMVAPAVRLAAGERAARIQALAQAVRSGTFRPNANALAEQILAAAEVEARLAQMVRG